MLAGKLATIRVNYEWLLFIAFPLFCFCLVIFLKRLRRQFPVQVNCWFCNRNTSRPYEERNSFTCPFCKQYNGFNEEGDYNKVIPEQQDELLNHIVTPRKLHSSASSNGLCQICNNNQQLKIYQLANFVPMNEDNHDLEIEHFQKQLEKAYKLCTACNTTVKKTIAKKNCVLLGKQIEEIRKSGKTLLNQSITAKRHASHLCFYFLCPIVILLVAVRVYNVKFDAIWEMVVVVLLQEYHRELLFAFAGSILSTTIMCFIRSSTSTPPPVSIKKIKTEKLFLNKSETLDKQRRISEGTNSQNSSAGDLSYASFNSPLNSTVRSEDGGSVCGNLDKFTANTSVQSMRSINTNRYYDLSDDFRHNSMCQHNIYSHPLLKKSPSAASLCSRSAFVPKSPLNQTFEQLHLDTTQPMSTSPTKRPILSPAKFRNPWTGKPWDTEVSSRSSSRSSGVYSRTTSICGDEIASLVSDHNGSNFANNMSQVRLSWRQ